jgi:hypothetical protein
LAALPAAIKRYEHQLEAVEKGKDREYFAYLMDPGTGKTRVCLLDLWHAYDKGEIDAMIVFAPNNVKDQWVKWPHMVNNDDDIDETTKHLGTHAARITKGLWISNATGENKKCWREFEDRISEPNNKFIILSMNYEALLIDQFFEFLKEFCKTYRVRWSPTRARASASRAASARSAQSRCASWRSVAAFSPAR